MSRLGMPIKVTARAILSIVTRGPHTWCSSLLIAIATFPANYPILHGSSSLSSCSERLVS